MNEEEVTKEQQNFALDLHVDDAATAATRPIQV